MKVTARPYQAACIEQLRACYREGKRAPLLVLPTGGGKTVIFSFIAEGAAQRDNAVTIVVHRAELLLQASANLESIGLPHGIIAPGHTPTRHLVQVASINTLVRRLHSTAKRQARKPALVVFDEGHHATAGMWGAIAKTWPDIAFLGVTATPCRADGAGLGREHGGVYDCMVQGPTIAELIADAYLVPPVVFAPPSVDLSGVRSRGGDFAKDEAAKVMDKPVITGSAVEHYRRICDGQPAIAFCASVAHSEHVAATFRAAGYRAQGIDGKMDSYQRRQLITALGNGQLNVLTSCDLLGEGVDVPVVSAAILLRPTQSKSLFLQQVGRALRPVYAPGYDLSTLQGRANAISASGKRAAVILDHVGNCLRHGLPDDAQEWSLAGDDTRAARKAKPQEGPAGRQCPQCFHMHRPAPVCPKCGHVYAGAMPKEVDGELQQLTPADADALKKKRLSDMQVEVARARDREALERIAAARGYKPGWIDHVMQSRAASGAKGGINPFATIKEWKGER